MKRPSIALACIMKNEAENIPLLLESVKDCFDEIHFTDTGSTDDSVKVAESLGAKVRHFEWVHDFAAARNFSFGGINTDFTMWLDLDDSLSDPAAFIDFRDHVLDLADFWIATYNYSFNKENKPVCSFSRERIIRNKRGFHWKYFLHEGLIHDGSMPTSSQFTSTWAVNHRRTAEDFEKDKNRNLIIFEKNLHQMDARMRYYYGKELFENGRAMEALTHLSEAIKQPGLEPHDRIIAAQYLCYALIQVERFDEAISIALTNLQVAPTRAELHAIIGDCYLKKNQPQLAIPYFQAAKGCTVTDHGRSFSPVFQSADAYSVYPRNQLARIYYHLGEVEKAKAEAQANIDMTDDAEAKTILAEFDRIKSITDKIEGATECPDIVITCPFSVYEWDPGVYKVKSMGGSETAAIEMAKWLHDLSGRPVKVFNPRKEAGTFDGVEYIPFEKQSEYFQGNKPFLHIAWRHNLRLTNAPTFLWCHDLTTPGAEATQNYVKMLCLTPFHRRYVMSQQGIPSDKIHVTRNGIVPGRFRGEAPVKDPFRFVFGSSPDRGLERTIRVLKKVRETHPLVNLHVFYGVEHLDKYGLSDLRKRLEEAFAENKDWLTYHGATQQAELTKWYKSASYNVQPSDWIETSMISAMELVACGVYPILRAVGGAVDTLRYYADAGMASLVHSNCVTESEHDVYVQEVLAALSEHRASRVSMDPDTVSWEGVAKDWLNDLPRFAYGDTIEKAG